MQKLMGLFLRPDPEVHVGWLACIYHFLLERKERKKERKKGTVHAPSHMWIFKSMLIID